MYGNGSRDYLVVKMNSKEWLKKNWWVILIFLAGLIFVANYLAVGVYTVPAEDATFVGKPYLAISGIGTISCTPDGSYCCGGDTPNGDAIDYTALKCCPVRDGLKSHSVAYYAGDGWCKVDRQIVSDNWFTRNSECIRVYAPSCPITTNLPIPLSECWGYFCFKHDGITTCTVWWEEKCVEKEYWSCQSGLLGDGGFLDGWQKSYVVGKCGALCASDADCSSDVYCPNSSIIEKDYSCLNGECVYKYLDCPVPIPPPTPIPAWSQIITFLKNIWGWFKSWFSL